MRIQVIQYSSSATEKEGITFSPLNAPRAIDDFDINIINLAVNSMWTYRGDALGMVDSRQDLDTIQKKRRLLYMHCRRTSIMYMIRAIRV